MDWIEIIGGGLTLFLAGGGVGGKLTDWLREHQARADERAAKKAATEDAIKLKQADANASAEMEVRGVLKETLAEMRKESAELKREVAELRRQLDQTELELAQHRLEAVKNQTASELRIATLERERAELLKKCEGLQKGYDRIKREQRADRLQLLQAQADLAAAVTREQALRLQLEELARTVNGDHLPPS